MPKAKVPAVSYRAEGPVYELFVTMRSTQSGTVLGLTWSVRQRGDEPGQGHRYTLRQESPKPVTTTAHAFNLVAWACRAAAAQRWVKVR